MKKKPTPTPDLSPSIDIDALNFLENAERDFIVELYNVDTAADALSKTQPIQFQIDRLSAFDITVPGLTLKAGDQKGITGVSNVGGGSANQNGDWLFRQTAGHIIATAAKKKFTIPANEDASIGFHIKRKAGIAANVSQSITVTIVAGSGGEIDTTNNIAVTTVSTN